MKTPKTLIAIALALLTFNVGAVQALRGEGCWRVGNKDKIVKDIDGQSLICRNGKFMLADEARRIKQKEFKPCLNEHGSNTWPDGSLVMCREDIDGVQTILNHPGPSLKEAKAEMREAIKNNDTAAMSRIEAEYTTAQKKRDEAIDSEDLTGSCKKGAVKATRRGFIATCKNGKWIIPMDTSRNLR